MSGTDTHRRTTLKALIWRFIGIFWTWGGAFVIITLLPDRLRTDPLLIATLVTAWHHSTRMVMYYFYERMWNSISWGRGATEPLSTKEKYIWSISIIVGVVFIFWLLMGVTPHIKNIQKEHIKNLSTEVSK